MIDNKKALSFEKKIDIFLNNNFLILGLNTANLGTRYFKEVIKLAYTSNYFDIKYKELCSLVSKKLNISIRKIDSNIYSSINSININLAKKNFKSLFNIDFDYFYKKNKKLTILFVNLLNNNF